MHYDSSTVVAYNKFMPVFSPILLRVNPHRLMYSLLFTICRYKWRCRNWLVIDWNYFMSGFNVFLIRCELYFYCVIRWLISTIWSPMNETLQLFYVYVYGYFMTMNSNTCRYLPLPLLPDIIDANDIIIIAFLTDLIDFFCQLSAFYGLERLT